MGDRHIVRNLCLALAILLLAAPLAAAEIEGVEFEDEQRIGEFRLSLHGTGLLRYRYVIKAYVAALYLEESVADDPDRALEDVPRRLEIEYFWPLRAEQFADATTEGIARTSGPAAVARHREQIDRLNALYEDVEPGDRYALNYLPGVGTELWLDDRLLGVVEGADFSAALFGIWLGDPALDAGLRDELLLGP